MLQVVYEGQLLALSNLNRSKNTGRDCLDFSGSIRVLKMGYFMGKSSKGLKLSRVKRSTYFTVKKRKSIDMSPRPSPCAKRGKHSFTPSSRKKI